MRRTLVTLTLLASLFGAGSLQPAQARSWWGGGSLTPMPEPEPGPYGRAICSGFSDVGNVWTHVDGAKYLCEAGSHWAQVSHSDGDQGDCTNMPEDGTHRYKYWFDDVLRVKYQCQQNAELQWRWVPVATVRYPSALALEVVQHPVYDYRQGHNDQSGADNLEEYFYEQAGVIWVDPAPVGYGRTLEVRTGYETHYAWVHPWQDTGFAVHLSSYRWTRNAWNDVEVLVREDGGKGSTALFATWHYC